MKNLSPIYSKTSLKMASRFLILIIGLNFLSSCMMFGMHGKNRSSSLSLKQEKPKSESVILDEMIDKAVLEFSHKDGIEIKTIAVWKLKTQSTSIDPENIRQKIITNLVNNTSYKVISREHLDKLLAEQSLSISGTIDSTSAISIGKLIGVEGFITGYISKQEKRIELSLSLIKTTTGEVLWSKFQKEKTAY
jgi:PBP1b-binding outer membrane lipoprotein LpoB